MGYLDKFNRPPYSGMSRGKKIWHFIWKEDSLESWIVNVILAFVLIKFLVYPGLGLLLGTPYPVVAVVSSSMHHDASFDTWWENHGNWYIQQGITKEEFKKFPMHNGFDKGDIMVLKGTNAESIRIGEVLVFKVPRPDPIIHRVVDKRMIQDTPRLQTKGDNNGDSIQSPLLNEMDIRNEQVLGKAFIRVPYLGYVKIWAVNLACLFGNYSFCIV